MKKAAVVTVSIILFVVLIGVNFLLWDNSTKKEDIEDLQTQEETKQQSLDKLYNDYWNEREANTGLRTQISDLQKTVGEKQTEIDTLTVDILDVYKIVGDKNTIMYQLKKAADTGFFKNIVDEWADNINNKAYFEAYRNHNEKDIFKNRVDILYTRYSEIFINIDFIEVVEFKVRVMDGEDSIDEEERNRIVFDALINVELSKDGEGFPLEDLLFNNGVNHFKITMAFDMNQWKWFIWTIE